MGAVSKRLLQKSITERDIQIFEYLGRHGFATRKILFEKFWGSDVTTCNHHRRFRRLIKLGVIEKMIGDGGELGLKLTIEGLSFIKSRGEEFSYLRPFKRSYRSQFEHDSLVQRVLFILESNSLVTDIETEKEVRHRIYSNQSVGVPDAMFILSTPKGSRRVAVEVEMTTKSLQRYEAIMRRQLTSNDWDIVLYLAKDTKILQVLSREHKKSFNFDPTVKANNKINGVYFTKIDDFIMSPQETLFKNDYDHFSLKALEEKLSPKQT